MATTKKEKKIVPFFGSGLLFDSARKGEGGKVDATGAFTVLHVWAFPSSTRTFHALITIYNLPKGITSVAVSIAKRGSRQIKSLALFDVESNDEKGNVILHLPIRHKFKKDGYHQIIFSFRDYPGKYKISFEIKSKKWPEFSVNERKLASDLKDAAPSFRVNVHCSDCGHAYIFEEQLITDSTLKGGVERFPESGVFSCVECGRELELDDIRGQLLESLKETLRQQIKGER